MADNTTLPGTGEVYASDEVEDELGVNVNFQLIKLAHGHEGTTPVAVSDRSPLPVTNSGIDEQTTLLRAILYGISIIANEEMQTLLDDANEG